MFVGNFLLYARKRMRLIRSTSGSERSSRIEGARDPWYPRLKKVLGEWKDGPRRIIRELALRRASKRNSRKRSVNVVNQDREFPVIDLSRSEGGHRDPDLNPHARTPVDRIGHDIDLERGEAQRERTTCRNLNPTTHDSIEAPRTRHTPEPSRGLKNHTRVSHNHEYQRHNLASSSRTSRVSTVVTRNSLSHTYQGAPQGRAAPAEEMDFSSMQTKPT
jgi:hypothetical protein